MYLPGRSTSTYFTIVVQSGTGEDCETFPVCMVGLLVDVVVMVTDVVVVVAVVVVLVVVVTLALQNPHTQIA